MELRRVHESDGENKESEVEEEVSASVIGSGRKNGAPKENGQSILSSVSKIVSQIKKPPHRKGGSPLNWFPRKKTDSFLKRKLKILQENDGMNLSLDETLGNANPHYTRIAKEKIAAREAARKAMEARKYAMVEASWCRILRAARIQSKEADEKLEKAEKYAAEAFEAARSKGVMMYDKPDSPRRACEIESNSSVGGRSTHTVTASFETAFEVDKEVMAAVKNAFIQLANCPSSSNKDESKDLLWKISQNPDNYEVDPEIDAEFSGEKCRQLLVNAMVDRLKGLQEDELTSLATIVATCGLNAALLELEHSKDHVLEPETHYTQGTGSRRNSNVREVPSLDKFLVKHVSRLEREVQEARKSKQTHVDVETKPTTTLSEEHKKEKEKEKHISDLGSVLVKHVSKLEKEIQEAKSSHKTASEKKCVQSRNSQVSSHQDKENINSNTQSGLDKILVKPVHRLEREKMQAVEQGNEYAVKRDQKNNGDDTIVWEGLDNILVKHVSRLEKERMAFRTDDHPITVKKEGQQTDKMEGLDEILVKHQSKLEKAKLGASQLPEYDIIKHRNHRIDVTASQSLDKILVRHQPELEKAKLAAAAEQSENYVKHVDARKEARERELQEAWGGLSLGNSIRPHLSRLELDRAAWKRAEDEERMLSRGTMK